MVKPIPSSNELYVRFQVSYASRHPDNAVARHATRFEVSVRHPALSAGAFDAQQTAAVQAVKFIQRLGMLDPE